MSTASSPTPRSGPGGADGLADAASVVVEGLHKSYGSLEVLKGISLSVGAGQVVCLIGPSGSGKSTLLRCVNLLETPQQGRITIGDFEVTDPEADVDRITNHVLGDACTPGNAKECTFETVRPVVEHCMNGDLDDLLG